MNDYIEVIGAREHNLKNINVRVPKNKLVVITGLSGSGKSSLAFDTIYAEGQRRYIESLSSYARQFLRMHKKPDLDSISGLSPAIAIDQKTTSKNPRSTVGTITEIYDHLRLLFARIGVPYSPATGEPIKSQTVQEMVDIILSLEKKTKIYILAPIARQAKGEFKRELLNAKKNGYQRAIVNGELCDLDELPTIDKNKKNDIEIIVDRISVSDDLGNRVADSIETALSMSDGIIFIQITELSEDTNNAIKVGDRKIFSEKYACPVSGFQIEELEPRIFSFNSPFGACIECHGLGKQKKFDPNLIVPFGNISISDGAIAPWQNSTSKLVAQTLQSLANHYKFLLDTPFSEYSDEIQEVLFYGSGKEEIEFKYFDGNISNIIKQPFGGIIPSLEEKLNKADTNWIKDDLSKYLSENSCAKCNGYRLKPESLCVKIDGLHVGEVTEKTIIDSQKWFKDLEKKLNQKDLKI
jgi:excinuclease ABC subunit A